MKILKAHQGFLLHWSHDATPDPACHTRGMPALIWLHLSALSSMLRASTHMTSEVVTVCV